MLIASSAGEIHAANARAAQLLDGGGPALRGRSLREFVSGGGEAELAAFLRAASRTTTLVPAGLKLRGLTCRCEGALLKPRSGQSDALVLLRLVPREAPLNRFVALNLRIEELGKEIGRRQRAEANLVAQRELLQVTLASIGDAVIATDADGRITFMNTVAETLTGWPQAEAAGRALGEVFLIANEATRALTARDGSIRPIDDSGAPIRSASGEVLGVVLVFRDASDRRNAERERAEADRRKDQFLAMLAHELRNPLAALGNGIQYFRLRQRESEDADPVATQLVGAMERQLRHLARLVDDLLDVSRLTTGKIVLRKAPVSLQSVLQNAVEACRPAIAQRETDLRLSLPVQPVIVQADAARLSQVFCNLLTNSVKFSQPGAPVEIDVALEAGRAAVRVKDAGAGIAPEMLRSIFDLFVQADDSLARSQGGLGVGLTVARLITELHGGTIEAHSEGRGRGSEFVVALPLAQGSEPPGARQATKPSAARSILVVDDNPDAATSFAMLLRASGHEVRVAYDGGSALREAESTRPDVVLLDVGMPGMDGYEVARRLREMEGTRNALIIAITGYGAEADRARARAAGFDHHLTKPVEVDALEGVISRSRA